MRVTSTHATFDLLNLAAQETVTFSSSENRSFCNLELLNVMHKIVPNFGTFELNTGQFLCGEFGHLDPQKIDSLAFLSTTASDENCKYKNIWVQADLSTPQDFIGVTLDFGEWHPKKIRVQFFKNKVEVGSSTIDNIEKNWAYVPAPGNGIDTIKLTFLESRFPFELARLQEFLLGNIIDFENDEIISANFQEETDAISKVLPNDTLTLTVFSNSDDFNVLKPRGAFAFLQTDQRFQVFETIIDTENDTTEEHFLGDFYLDTWKSETNQKITFNLVSPLGLLDKSQFKKSRMYSGLQSDNAKAVLEEIFYDAGWHMKNNIEIDSSLEDIYLMGYIPVCTHKQAIQQVAFACSCIVIDTRSEKIQIKPYNSQNLAEIPTTNIFEPIKIERKETVTGVDVEVHNFVAKAAPEDVFKGFLQKGTREIIFKEPCKDLSATSTNIQIVTSGVNYAVLEVLSDGEYTLKGTKFEDKSYKYQVGTEKHFMRENIVSIEKATLINSRNCRELAENLLDFYQENNLTVEFKFLSNNELTGQNVIFRTTDGKAFLGSFVRQNIDLTGGYRSDCYIVGRQQVELETSDYYCSNETPPSVVDIYAGEPFGLI